MRGPVVAATPTVRTPVRPAALVEAWFDLLPETHRPMARELQGLVLAAEPGLTQGVKWGNLVFALGGGSLIAIVAHKSHLNLQLFNGAALAPQWRQLEGSGKGLRSLKCRLGQPLDAALVRALVQASVAEAQQT